MHVVYISIFIDILIKKNTFVFLITRSLIRHMMHSIQQKFFFRFLFPQLLAVCQLLSFGTVDSSFCKFGENRLCQITDGHDSDPKMVPLVFFEEWNPKNQREHF